MPSTFESAVGITRDSLVLAVVPAVATLLATSKIARALTAGPGAGISFPFPTGLPTLWTYVSLPMGPTGGAGGGPLSLVAFVPLLVLGILLTSALEAGFLGALDSRIDGGALAFVDGVREYGLRIVGVNVIRTLVVFAALPVLFVAPPLALVLVVLFTYLIYGLPFEVVAADCDLTTALHRSLDHAASGGAYFGFGVAHLLAGAVASLGLTTLARNGGAIGILLGGVAVAVPAVFVATYGLLVFRDLGEPTTEPGPGAAHARSNSD